MHENSLNVNNLEAWIDSQPQLTFRSCLSCLLVFLSSFWVIAKRVVFEPNVLTESYWEKKKHFFTPNWPLVTLDNRTLFIKLAALQDVHSLLLVLFLSDIHKQHCRKCLKFHLWPPITRGPGVRFTWESVYSTELIEVYRIPKIDQLLFRYLFSPKISIFCRNWPLPYWPWGQM